MRFVLLSLLGTKKLGVEWDQSKLLWKEGKNAEKREENEKKKLELETR